MAKVRVYELAREIGVSPKEMLAKLKELGVGARNASSMIPAGDVSKVRGQLGLTPRSGLDETNSLPQLERVALASVADVAIEPASDADRQVTVGEVERGDSSATKVLVATVGLSPIPVTLSILTLKPDVVVLVSTFESEKEVERIEKIIEVRLPGIAMHRHPMEDDAAQSFAAMRESLGLRGPEEPLARPVSWEDGTLGELLEEKIGPGTEFVLDYTGGTKVMVACMVEFHTVWHGEDRPGLRCYVAGRDDGLRFADSDRPLALACTLTLEDRAFLNGYWFKQGWRRIDPTGASLLDEVVQVEIANRGPNPPTVADFNAGYRDQHFEPLTEFVDQPGVDDDGAVAGAVAEALLVELAVRESGQLSLDPTEVEVLLNVKPVAHEEADRAMSERDLAADLAEFDLVWRLGNTVLVGEAKRKLGQNRARERTGAAVTRALLAPEVFGDAVSSLFWGAQYGDQDLVSQINQLVKALGQVPAMGYGRYWQLTHANRLNTVGGLNRVAAELRDKLNELRKRHAVVEDFDPWRGRPTAAPVSRPATATREAEDAGSAARLAQTSVLAVAGGSPLATFLVARLPFEHRAVLMTRGQRSQLQQYLRGVQSPELADDSVALSELLVREQLQAQAMRAGHPSSLYITPGTKAVSAAMAAFALEKRVDLIHVSAASDSVVSRSGSPIGVWEGKALDWKTYLSREWRIDTSDTPTERLIAGTTSGSWGRRHLNRVVSAWAAGRGADLTLSWPRLHARSAQRSDLDSVIEEQICPDAVALHDRQVTLVHAFVIADMERRRHRTAPVRELLKQRVAFSQRIFGDAIRHTIIVIFGRKDRLFGDKGDASSILGQSPFSIMSARQREATTRLVAVTSPQTEWWNYEETR